MKKLVLSVILFTFYLLLSSCQVEKPKVQIEPIVQKYLAVWNGGSLDALDTLVTENFEIRNNPTFEPKIGIEALKKYITESRTAFPDFNVSGKQITILGDTALVTLWTISGTYYNPENPKMVIPKTSSQGFSVIFFNDNKLTGEWIAFSDLSWYKGMGYELTIPNKK
jgi:hypothetical protein